LWQIGGQSNFFHAITHRLPEVEARLLMHKARLKVVELPVKMFQRMAGKSSINFNGSLYYVLKLLLLFNGEIRKIHDV
jgi:hypothetical protein